MKATLLICTLCISACFFIGEVKGQSLNGIYGINNIPPTAYAAKIDSASGNVFNIAAIPFYFGGQSLNSTFTDPYSNRFYYSNGLYIAGFNLNNSTLILHDTFPLPSGEVFMNIVFNACDTAAYGMHYNAGLAKSRLAKYNLTTGAFTDISAYVMNSATYGIGYSIDLYNQLYVYSEGNFKGYDLTTGQVVLDTPIQNVPGEGLTHIVYDCVDSNFYGTSVNTSAGSKYFAKINPLTGVVSHVSANNLNAYYFKNADALFTIDPFSGIYYFRSGNLISVDINTGIGSANNLNAGFFNRMTYHPQCQCNLSTHVTHLPGLKERWNISPNPAKDFIFIQYDLSSSQPTTITLFNIYGQTIKTIVSKNQPAGAHEMKIDLKDVHAGIYFVKLNWDGKEEMKKIMIE